jgi:hypothetical protein
MGAFVDDDVVVYGTGWSYPSWCAGMYYGGPWTYGFGYGYSYWGGGWFAEPFHRHWWYHDWPHMHRLYSEYWRPGRSHPDLHWIHNNVNAYNRWGGGVIRDEPALPGAMGAVAPALTGAAAVRSPDLYAGRDGHVYEHRRDGWYRHTPGSQWSHVDSPGPVLIRERHARALGSARWSEFHAGGHPLGMARGSSLHTGMPRSGLGRSALGHSSVGGGGGGHASFGSGLH